MKLKDQILASCSLLLVLNGCNLFVTRRILLIVRCIFRVWFIVCAITLANGAAVEYYHSHLSLSFLAYLSYAFGFVVSCWILMMRRKRYEDLIAYLISNMTTTDLSSIRNLILAISVPLFVFYSAEIVTFNLLNYYPPSDVARNKIVRNFVNLSTSWIAYSAGFYVIVIKMLFLYHKSLLLDLVKQISCGRIDHVTISRKAKLIRDSSRDFDRLFSVFPFLWFVFGILGAPGALTRTVAMRGAQQLVGLTFALRNFATSLMVALLVSVSKSSLSDTVNEAQDWIMIQVLPGKSACEDGLAIRELDSIKSINFTGLSFFSLDKSFILSYIGTVCTFAALIASYTNNV